MPLENEHAARQTDPDGYERFGRKDGPSAGLSFVIGFKQGGGSDIQSIRADASEWEVEKFKAWLEENDFKSTIEEATGELAEEDEEAEDSEEEAKPFSEYGSMVPLSLPRILPMDEGENGKWVELARSGNFHGRGSDRRVTLSTNDIKSLAAGYEQILAEGWFSRGAPIGYNHATVSGAVDPESTKAAGRILSVRTEANSEGGLSLWGRVQWTDEAKKRIRAGEFDGFSIEAIPEASARSKLDGEPLGHWALIGGTLTNEPFVPGMAAVAATETDNTRGVPPHTEIKMSDILTRLAEATGLPTEAPELMAEVKRLQVEADKVTVLTEALDTATSDLDKLRTRNADLEDREKVRVLDEACTAGRISAAERDDYWQIVQTLGEEKAHRLFVAGRLPVDVSGIDAGAPDGATTTHDQFINLIDEKVASGLSESDAWDAAKSALGSTIYPTTVEA